MKLIGTSRLTMLLGPEGRFREHGGDAVAALAPSSTTEELFLLSKVDRAW